MDLKASFLSQLKILYVEDELETRKELEIFLKRRAGKVFTAADGVEGYEKYKLHKPDIIIVDLIMPRLDGMGMIKRLKREGANCKIIITSTVKEIDTVIDAIDEGIAKYIIKPIKLDTLSISLEKIGEELKNLNRTDILLDATARKKQEDTLKKDYSIFLKDSAGKGPRDVSVFIKLDEISITIYDGLTVLEKSLLRDKGNLSLVEHIRRSFYMAVKLQMETLVGNIASRKVTMMSADIRILDKMDILIFKIKEGV